MRKVGVIVPYRGERTDKSRLRPNLDSQTVDELLLEMVQNVIYEIMKVSRIRNIYLLTKNANIGFNGNYRVFLDKQSDLNAAVAEAKEEIKEEIILIIMADLPLIKCEDIEIILNSLENYEVVIAPSGDNGTSVLGFHKHINLEFVFGNESSIKFKEQLEKHKIRFKLLKHKKSFMDIDELNDIVALIEDEILPHWMMKYLRLKK
ncbi:MAG: 2-phospho-L-lactate guanylyltransferase [Candidatus Heimdallarchaeaceae archaeon]